MALIVVLGLVPKLALAQELTADWPHWAYGYLAAPTADELDIPPCPADANRKYSSFTPVGVKVFNAAVT